MNWDAMEKRRDLPVREYAPTGRNIVRTVTIYGYDAETANFDINLNRRWSFNHFAQLYNNQVIFTSNKFKNCF